MGTARLRSRLEVTPRGRIDGRAVRRWASEAGPSLPVLVLVFSALVALRAGLKDPTAIEFAPAVPPGSPPRLAAWPGPGSGPWFVDRARDYGLDAVTRCGDPDKPSVLHS